MFQINPNHNIYHLVRNCLSYSLYYYSPIISSELNNNILVQIWLLEQKAGVQSRPLILRIKRIRVGVPDCRTADRRTGADAVTADTNFRPERKLSRRFVCTHTDLRESGEYLFYFKKGFIFRMLIGWFLIQLSTMLIKSDLFGKHSSHFIIYLCKCYYHSLTSNQVTKSSLSLYFFMRMRF